MSLSVTKVSSFFLYPEIESPIFMDSYCSFVTVLGRSEFVTIISKRGYRYNPFLLYLFSIVSSTGVSLIVLVKWMKSAVNPTVIIRIKNRPKIFFGDKREFFIGPPLILCVFNLAHP